VDPLIRTLLFEYGRWGIAMRFCTNCGERVPPGANFCGKCGTPLDSDQTGDTGRPTHSESSPEDPGSQALEAKALGHFEQAEVLYRQAIQSGDLVATTNYGIMLWQLSRFREARDQFLAAARGGYGAAWWDLGNMYHENEFFSLAITAWESSLPFRDDGYQSLLAFNARRQQMDEAWRWAAAGTAAGMSLTEASQAIQVAISELKSQAGEDALELASHMAASERLAEEEATLQSQVRLCQLRRDLAQRRPLGEGKVGELFDAVGISTGLGPVRLAGQVIPAKAELWRLAADSYAVMLELLVSTESDEESVLATALQTSSALQESLVLAPRQLSQREQDIVFNITGVFDALEHPLAEFYEMWRPADHL